MRVARNDPRPLASCRSARGRLALPSHAGYREQPRKRPPVLEFRRSTRSDPHNGQSGRRRATTDYCLRGFGSGGIGRRTGGSPRVSGLPKGSRFGSLVPTRRSLGLLLGIDDLSRLVVLHPRAARPAALLLDLGARLVPPLLATQPVVAFFILWAIDLRHLRLPLRG
jgi:hypothetical protein